MKRYRVGCPGCGSMNPEEIHGGECKMLHDVVTITENHEGEWVKFEDVTETILFQAATAQIDEMKKHFHDQTLQLAAIKKANDEYNAAPGYANWQEKHKLSSLLGMIK